MEKEALAAAAAVTRQKKNASSLPVTTNIATTRSPATAKKLPLRNNKNMASSTTAAATTAAAATVAAAETTTGATAVTTTTTIDAAWMQGYERLVKYKKAASHVDVPDDDGSSTLSRWVEQQHRDYSDFIDVLEDRVNSRNKNSPLRMNEEKLKLLARIGIHFLLNRLVEKCLFTLLNTEIIRRLS
jgi:Helicase associated domain